MTRDEEMKAYKELQEKELALWKVRREAIELADATYDEDIKPLIEKKLAAKQAASEEYNRAIAVVREEYNLARGKDVWGYPLKGKK